MTKPDFKFVYALTSKPGDYFTEQTYVSMYSLKKHNPDAHITLVTDKDTPATLTGNRGRLNELVDEFIAVEIPAELTPVQKNRFLKTSLRMIVKGDFLYLDNDTVILADLSPLEKLECEFGAVKDQHKLLDPKHHQQLKMYLKTTKKKFWNYYYYFNGGVLFVRDTENTRQLFSDWHHLWNEERVKYGINIDQPSFSQSNIKNGCMIQEIDDVYNCMVTQKCAVPFLFDAKIVHYFSNSPSASLFPLTQADVLQKIRDHGITEEIEVIIRCPQLEYLKNSLIIGGEELAKKHRGPFMVLSRKLERTFPFLNGWARLLYRMFGVKL